MDRRTLYVDVDDTLLMHNLSEYAVEAQIVVCCNGRAFIGVPNVKNIGMLTKFYNLGYQIHVWSKTGESWAKAVGEKLKIDHMVTSFLTKPDFYLDDKEVNDWIGPRVF